MRHVRPEGDCLIWTSTSAGSNLRYGTFGDGTKYPNGSSRKVYAHRWIWEFLNGPIPEDFEVDHVKDKGCTSTLCVKPAHLEAVTRQVNMERMRRKVCRAGKHDLTDPVNVFWAANGNRGGCLPCRRESALAFYHANKTLREVQ